MTMGVDVTKLSIRVKGKQTRSKQVGGSELSGEFSGELARRDKTASTPPVGMSPSESAQAPSAARAPRRR